MTIINTNSIAGITSIVALDSQPFSIYDTNGYNRLTLDTSGNITILGTLTVSNLNYTYLNVTGVSTFNNGPVLIGSGTSTGTSSQPLQVTGKAYVSNSVGIGTTNSLQALDVIGNSYISGNLGIGTTNPTSKLNIVGNVSISGIVTASEFSGVSRIGISTAKTGIGSTSVLFADLPSWAKKVTVMFDDVSTNGTNAIIIRLGTSSGIDASSYRGNCIGNSGGATYTASNVTSNAFAVSASATAAKSISGAASIINITSNQWVVSGTMSRSDGSAYGEHFAGGKTLSSTLSQILITTVGGTNTFDSGTFNVLYEG